MKKLFIVFICFFNFCGVCAKEIEVSFSECVDGDTAKFIYKDNEITARFLAIDTPETVHPTKGVEPYGKEASEFTCNRLKSANTIILEYDNDSDKTDKYDRHLVWVFVDGELLQKKLIEKGFASVAYLYGDYKYTNELEEAEQIAEENKLGIWSKNTSGEALEQNNLVNDKINQVDSFIEKYKEYIILIGALIIIYIFNLKSKNKVVNKLKSKIKKDLKKRL